ncbi:MAG: hydrogenase [Kiritimatiellae bacterium]|nr:hydrogenase [Kiritimatiellia bacterium]
MLTVSEIVLAMFLLSNLTLAGSGRLNHAIRLVAAQGWAVGLSPLLLWDWQCDNLPELRLWLVAVVNILVKGIALPMLLAYAVRKANTRRELEPIVSFRLSQLIVFLMAVGGFAIGSQLGIQEAAASKLAIPVAFTTMGTGLLLICARKKAITQVIGFLILENGISVFGAGMLLEYGLIVELGILLDVFALVFILGIAIFQINRTFSSTDTDKLNHLGDTHLMHQHHQHHRTHA